MALWPLTTFHYANRPHTKLWNYLGGSFQNHFPHNYYINLPLFTKGKVCPSTVHWSIVATNFQWGRTNIANKLSQRGHWACSHIHASRGEGRGDTNNQATRTGEVSLIVKRAHHQYYSMRASLGEAHAGDGGLGIIWLVTIILPDSIDISAGCRNACSFTANKL